MKSLNKAINILSVFLDNKQELSLSEICTFTGLSKATASRICSTLVKHKFLAQPEYRGKISLGPVYFRYSGLIKSRVQLRKIATSYTIKLSQRLHEAIVIGYINGKENIFTETYHDISIPETSLLMAADEDACMPLYCTSIGKIILAEMTKEELDEYLRNNVLEKRTPNTITDPSALKQDLIRVKQENVALDNEEFQSNLKTIGAGVRNVDAELVGAIALAAPNVRLPQEIVAGRIAEVKTCAQEISAAMGYSGRRIP